MAPYVYDPETGQRVLRVEAPAEQPVPAVGPPMADPGFVESFLNGQVALDRIPRSSRPPRHRPYGARRRVR